MPEWVEVRRCPLCGEGKFEPFDRRIFRDVEVVNVMCSHCGLVIQSPRMSDEDLDRYYEREYALSHQGVKGVSEKELRVQSGRARHMLELLKSENVIVTSHLDIGSSTGMLLELTQAAFGCRVVGVEPGEIYQSYSRARGIEVVSSLEDVAEFPQPRFDLISMSHVLEHLADPVRFLEELKENYLTQGGTLLLEVPNLFGHTSFEAPHLTSFHRGTLRDVLQQAGFRVDLLKVHGRPRSKLLPLYLAAIAQPSEAPEPIRWSSRGVRRRRKLGMGWKRAATRLAPHWAWPPVESIPLIEPAAGEARSIKEAG